MSSLTVRDMIGLSVGKAFASAASNSGLNWSSTARNVPTRSAYQCADRVQSGMHCHQLIPLKNDLQCSLCVVLQSCGGRAQSVTAQTWWRCVRHREQWRLCWSKFAIVAQCVFKSRQGHQLLRPLSNNTKATSQCVNCLIFIHTVTTALSDCPLNHFTWQLYSHKSHSVISCYSSIQQGVDTHPCLVTIYRLFTDTGQEVSAPNVSTHNRHKLSHQLSVVIASTDPSALPQRRLVIYGTAFNILFNYCIHSRDE